jgi:hypothetical protein
MHTIHRELKKTRDNLAPGGLINPSYNKMKEKRKKACNERMRGMSLENK